MSKDEWISIKDKLPSISNGMYLVAYLFQGKHLCRAVAAWYGGYFHAITLEALDVTHWQELPDLPELSTTPAPLEAAEGSK